MNGSKAWSVGIKRNKDYIFIGEKTGLLHAEALTIQNSPEFKVFPAVGGVRFRTESSL